MTIQYRVNDEMNAIVNKSKSIITTKGMSLLPRDFKNNINHWP